MPCWETLSHDFERRAIELKSRAADHLRQEEYAAWAHDAVQRIIARLETIVRQHVARFPDAVRAELDVKVEEPSVGHRVQRVLCIGFGADSVHLHAQWRRGAPPSLHVLLSRKRAGRDARLITLPGGFLRPVSDERGFELCPFDGSRNEVSLEELAYRALRLLAAGI